MAEELRWENLISQAIIDTSAFGEFRNDTSVDINIRSIDMTFAATLDDTGAGDGDAEGTLQLSKSNTIDQANNSTIFQLNAAITFMNTSTGNVGSAGGQMTVNKLYAKGQLILEPGESFFAHLDYSEEPPTQARAHISIGYHF